MATKKSLKPKTNFNITLYAVIAFIIALLFSHTARNTSLNTSNVLGQTNNAYYVSPGGDDKNNGSSIAPFKTFAKAQSQASTNDAIYLLPGVYNETIKVTKDNLSIYGNKQAVIDAKGKWSALEIHSNNVLVDGIEAMHSESHIVYIVGKNITFRNSYIHDGVYENRDTNTGYPKNSGWGSGLSLKHTVDNGQEKMAENITIDNVKIERVYGEGMDMYGVKNVKVTNTTIIDSFSIGFYIDNSHDIHLERNFAYCSGNPLFKRNNQNMAGFSMALEKLESWHPTVKWGAQLNNIRIINNISYNCNGLTLWGSRQDSNVPNNGLQNAVIAHNTIIHQHAGSSIWFATLPGNSNIQVINNLVSGNIPTAKNATYEGNINNVSYVATVFQPKYIVPQEGRDKGIKNNITNIDFGGNIRDDKPDVGAWEIGSNTTATLTPTQDQSPPTVQTPTPTSTIQSNTKPKIKITKKVLISKNAKEYFNYFTATDTDTSDVLKMSVTGLPDGITLKSCNNTKNDNEVSLKCQVSGTPNKKGKYSITITVSDDKNDSTTKKFTFRVW